MRSTHTKRTESRKSSARASAHTASVRCSTLRGGEARRTQIQNQNSNNCSAHTKNEQHNAQHADDTHRIKLVERANKRAQREFLQPIGDDEKESAHNTSKVKSEINN